MRVQFGAGLRRVLAIGLLIAGSFSVFVATRGEAAQTVSCTNSSQTTVCVINQPIVTQRLTPYPQITFKPGDVVTVSAGGCVQTGGRGKTWKRYVNPSGSNADRLYHGLIQIPGVESDLVRIQGAVLHPLVVPNGSPQSGAFLRLGYEDDGFSDNGYYSHDDGTEDQCKGVGDAFVRLSIQHHGVAPTASAAPFDLVFADTDPNDLPLNPEWAWQKQTGQLPDADKICFPLAGDFNNPSCTTQTPSYDNPSGISSNNAICAIGAQHSIHGHVNWMPATMRGPLLWDNHSGGITGDDDYNINIQTPGHVGETASNGGHIHTEFDSDETSDHFNTPIWNTFHTAVDVGDDSPTGRPAQMINGRLGIIIGLVGLDCEHGCATELHPVYGLAMNVQGSDASDDEWAIFVRNWGNEGYCSQYQHFLDTSRMAFMVPAPSPAATGVTVTSAIFKTNSGQAGGPSVTFVNGQGALVVFTLPDPSQKARINGELHLKWTVPAGGPPLHRAPIRAVLSRTASAEGQSEAEDMLKSIEGRLSPEARKTMTASLHTVATPDESALTPLSSSPGRPARAATVRAVADPDKAKVDLVRSEALCRAFASNVPNAPQACANIPK